MNTHHIERLKPLIAAGLLLAVFAACDTLNKQQEEDIPQEELEIAGQIIGNSLSDTEEGLFSSLYDAVSDVDEEGIQSRMQDQHRDQEQLRDHGRGSESDYHYDYNPETGEHTVWYVRKYEGPLVSRSLKVRSKYIYTDINGRFIQYPKRQQDRIETIDYKGSREGITEGTHRYNRFYRFNQFYLDGLSSVSTVMTLTGSHHGNGEMNAKVMQRDMVTSRTYELDMNLDDIRIDKEVVQENGSLEDGITGFISYRLTMTRTVNGETFERNLSGVIELTGDGTALLRFDKLREFFRIGLATGSVERPDNTDGSHSDRPRS
jgi:hypothetical protein